MTSKTTAHGRSLIVAREGCRLRAYQDSIGVWTIGVGHTGRASPPAVTEGMTITAAQVDEILSRDLVPFERAVLSVSADLAPNRFDACVSLAFNIGPDAFKRSSVAHLITTGDMAGAAEAFLMWDKAAGQVIKGLQSRRADERRQFLTPYPSAVLIDPPISKPAPIPREPPVLPPAKPKLTTGQAAAGALIAAGGVAVTVAPSGHWALWAGTTVIAFGAAVLVALHLRKAS